MITVHERQLNQFMVLAWVWPARYERWALRFCGPEIISGKCIQDWREEEDKKSKVCKTWTGIYCIHVLLLVNSERNRLTRHVEKRVIALNMLRTLRQCLTSTLSSILCSVSLRQLGHVWFFSIVQELCESRGGHPGLSVLTTLLVSVDVKNY